MGNTGLRGRAAETMAAAYLELAGLQILERNAQLGGVEIDLLALEKRVHVVVEVKYRSRSDFGGGLGAIDAVVGRQQRAHRVLVVADDRCRDPPRRRQQLVVWHHLGDQPGTQRVGGRQIVTRQAHPAGYADAGLLRQPHRQPPGGKQTHPGVGVGEAGLLGGDQDVAVQREFEAARHGRAVDGADHGFCHRRPLRRDIRQLRRIAQLLEVQARAEHRVGAGDDDDVDVVIGLRIAQRAEETPAEVGR